MSVLAKRSVLLSGLILFGVLVLFTPAPKVAGQETGDMEWVRQFGTKSEDVAVGIAVDSTGMYVIQNSAGLPFILKFDADGKRLWKHVLGVLSFPKMRGISAHSTGVYVVGTSFGTTNAFVIKYDADGNRVWPSLRRFRTAARLPLNISVTASGIYVAGNTEVSSSDQDKTLFIQEPFIRKYNLKGTELWIREFETDFSNVINGISGVASGVYVVGRTHGALPGQESAGGTDAFIRKYDPDGIELWTRQYGTPGSDFASGVAAHPSGVYVVGWTLKGRDDDAFVYKYDTEGNQLWARQFSTMTLNPSDLAISADLSGVYVAGWTEESFPGLSSAGGDDAFVRMWDNHGVELWTSQFGTQFSDRALAVAADSSGLYLAGQTEGAFPRRAGGGGISDAFVAKFVSTPSADLFVTQTISTVPPLVRREAGDIVAVVAPTEPPISPALQPEAASTPTPAGQGGCTAPAAGVKSVDVSWLLLGLLWSGLVSARRKRWIT